MIAPPAPTLTAQTTPCPGVEVFFPALSVDVNTITVLRTADGVTEPVAGALNATASGDFVVTDWRVPFGVTVTYVGEVFDVSGASLLSAQAMIQVNSSEVWFQNSIDPSESFTVELNTPNPWEVTRSTNNQQVFVAGMPRPFNQFWGQGALTQVPLLTMTNEGADTANLNGVTEWPQLLVRTPSTFETLPRLLYAAITDARHQYPVNVQTDALVTWVLIVNEVQPFSAAVLRPLITWDDWRAAFPGDQGVWNGTPGLSSSSTPAIITPGYTNLSTNPSGEVSTAGYSVYGSGTNGTGALTNPAPSSTTAYGSKVIKCTFSVAQTAGNNGTVYTTPAAGVTPGLVYSFKFNHVKTSITQRMQMTVNFYNSVGAFISGFSSVAVATSVGVITSLILENVTAPALADRAVVNVVNVAGTGFQNWSVSSYLELDGFMFVAGATVSLAIPPRTITYFDGDSPIGYLWDDVIAIYGAGTWTNAIRTGP